MTREEIGKMVAALPQGIDADDFIHRLVNWAVDLEREACAKVCDEREKPNLYGVRECATAIRARTNK